MDKCLDKSTLNPNSRIFSGLQEFLQLEVHKQEIFKHLFETIEQHINLY